MAGSGETLKLHCEYLVVGCGAAAIAFVDTLLTEWSGSEPPSVIMVDRREKPGGHWCDSYPFGRLHQPAAFYGVNSKVLGDPRDRMDVTNLSSGQDIKRYYEEVLQNLEAKGVRFLTKHEYDFGRSDGLHVLTSLASPTRKQYVVEVAKKLVNGAYVTVTVPSTHPPKYAFDKSETKVVPLNALPSLPRTYEVYTVVGAGKTGIDACLWLIENKVAPDKIHWVMPNDAWMFTREWYTEARLPSSIPVMLSAFTNAENLEQFYHHMESAGLVARLDPSREPTNWRCATVSEDEMAKLRSIKTVIRKGRVERITANEVVLQKGTHPISSDTVFIDCTSDGLARHAAVPVFQGDRIVLQPISQCQSVYSGAFIGFIESRTDLVEAEKNRQCIVIPHPAKTPDFIQTLYYQYLAETSRDYKSFMFNWRSRLSANYHLFRLRNFFPMLRVYGSALPYLLRRKRIAAQVAEGGAFGDFERVEANDKIIADYDSLIAERKAARRGWLF